MTSDVLPEYNDGFNLNVNGIMYNPDTDEFYDEVDSNLTIEERVYNYIKRGSVSFAEIQKRYGEGHHAIECPDSKNSFYWFGLKDDVANAICNLMNDRHVLAYPSSTMVYMVDGIVPKVPISKGYHAYKTRRWMPVVLYRTDADLKWMSNAAKKMYRDGGWKV